MLLALLADRRFCLLIARTILPLDALRIDMRGGTAAVPSSSPATFLSRTYAYGHMFVRPWMPRACASIASVFLFVAPAMPGLVTPGTMVMHPGRSGGRLLSIRLHNEALPRHPRAVTHMSEGFRSPGPLPRTGIPSPCRMTSCTQGSLRYSWPVR